MIELEGLEPISTLENANIQIRRLRVTRFLDADYNVIERGHYAVLRVGGSNPITVRFNAAKDNSGKIGAAVESGIEMQNVAIFSEALDGRGLDFIHRYTFNILGRNRLETPIGLFSRHMAQYNRDHDAAGHVTDGWGKVWRHVTWQGILSIAYGRQKAENIGNAFERGSHPSSLHGDTANRQDWSFIDIINNEYGRRYAKEFLKNGNTLKNRQDLVKFLNFTAKKVVDAYNEHYAPEIKAGNRDKVPYFKFTGKEKEVRRLSRSLVRMIGGYGRKGRTRKK